MKLTCSLGLTCLTVISLVAQSQVSGQTNFWEPLPGMYGSISSASNGTLYVLGGAKLLRSSDDGTAWDTIPLPSALEYFSFCADTEGMMFLGADDRFFRSTDRGASWTQLQIPSTSVYYVSAVAIGGNGSLYAGVRLTNGVAQLLTSTDRGTSWILVKSVSNWSKSGHANRFIYDMMTDRSGHVYMGGYLGGALMSMNNSPWTRFLALPRTKTIVFGHTDDNEIVAVARDPYPGALYRSRSSGARWQRLRLSGLAGGVLSAVKVGGVYYVGTTEAAYQSTNDGATWSLVYSGFPGSRVPVDNLVIGRSLYAQISGYIYRSTAPVGRTLGDPSADGAREQQPFRYSLLQNYPNPFNPMTSIDYELPGKDFVSLRIYNALGQEVSTLVNDVEDAGYYSLTWDGTNCPSGVYFYRMNAVSISTPGKTFSQVKKMLLVK